MTTTLSSVQLMPMLARCKRAFMLAPHPDDFDAIGVTMRMLREHGVPIWVTVLTGSSSGVLDSFCGSDAVAKEAAREAEQRASAHWFGLPDENLSFLYLPEDAEGHLLPSPDAEEAIRKALCAVGPDVVFLPHGNDTNPSHRRVAGMFRGIAQTWPRFLTACYIRDPKTQDMRVDAVVPFDEEMARWKAELLRFHASQHQRNLIQRNHGFDDRILKVNRQIARDLELSVPYAEAFEVERFHCAG